MGSLESLKSGAVLQVERIANTEPVNIDVPGITDVSKASADRARQLGVGIPTSLLPCSAPLHSAYCSTHVQSSCAYC